MIKKLNNYIDEDYDYDLKLVLENRSKINEIIEYINFIDNNELKEYIKNDVKIINEYINEYYLQKNYIKKEDLKKYLEEFKDKKAKENRIFELLQLDSLFYINNGIKDCCDIIIKKFSL